jgi:hypothetical protein
MKRKFIFSLVSTFKYTQCDTKVGAACTLSALLDEHLRYAVDYDLEQHRMN